MHRADPYASRPSPHRRGRHDSPHRGGPASSLLEPSQDLPPSTLTPRRAQVWICELPRPAPRRRPGIWIGNYRIRVLDVITIVSGITVLLAIFWLH